MSKKIRFVLIILICTTGFVFPSTSYAGAVLDALKLNIKKAYQTKMPKFDQMIKSVKTWNDPTKNFTNNTGILKGALDKISKFNSVATQGPMGFLQAGLGQFGSLGGALQGAMSGNLGGVFKSVGASLGLPISSSISTCPVSNGTFENNGRLLAQPIVLASPISASAPQELHEINMNNHTPQDGDDAAYKQPDEGSIPKCSSSQDDFCQ